MPSGSVEAATHRASKLHSFLEKPGFFASGRCPISWGTGAIMLLPVVDFKKNFQKSYKRVIPK
jgi:hypothetical protein